MTNLFFVTRCVNFFSVRSGTEYPSVYLRIVIATCIKARKMTNASQFQNFMAFLQEKDIALKHGSIQLITICSRLILVPLCRARKVLMLSRQKKLKEKVWHLYLSYFFAGFEAAGVSN